jgi:hypothetical protein
VSYVITYLIFVVYFDLMLFCDGRWCCRNF